MADTTLTRILDHLETGHRIEKKEITYLLGLSDPKNIDRLFMAAQGMRARHFGNRIFLYGFLYFSTHCRNNCRFCQYRRANTALDRYRKNESQILAAAREMAGAGVHLIDLTMGEDPELYSSGELGFKPLVRLVRAVQKETGLPLMISPGVLPDKVLFALAEAKVSWYACYQETHSKTLYGKLRQGQDFEKRLAKKKLAKKLGMLTEEGLLTGVGETLDDLADSIMWMKDNGVDQARVMTFVPQEGTPMAGMKAQGNLRERMVIAVMRLVLQDVLIPASLDVDGLEGLAPRLVAGANVVTSIVPPQNGLAGVAHNSLDIEESRRSLGQIIPILETCGLASASPEDYRAWTRMRRGVSQEKQTG